MPYAVTLPLDATAADRVRRMWHALAEQAGADDALRLDYPPHITLAVLPDHAPFLEVEQAVLRAVEGWKPFSFVLAGFGVFPGTPSLIWPGPVVTAGLLACHSSLCAELAPFAILPHHRPGHWVPHVTLSQERLSASRHRGPHFDLGGTYQRAFSMR
jgi:2'-5' RNA ligase